MPTTARQAAFRDWFRTVQDLLKTYPVRGIHGIALNQTSQTELLRIHRLLLRRVHPDKGGSNEDFNRLYSSKEQWDACAAMPAPAHPSHDQADTTVLVACGSGLCPFCPQDEASQKYFRIQATAVLLTYNSFADLAVWERFKTFVTANRKRWKVLYYCATMELCLSKKRHIHLMLQFLKKMNTNSHDFEFEGKKPNCRVNRNNLHVDYCGEGTGGNCPQKSFDRGFFYVFADKIGTCRDASGAICVWGNYAPVWTSLRLTYQVMAPWIDKLWTQRKLSHAVYDTYVVDVRQGVPMRRRNLREVMAAEDERADQAELEANVKRIRGDETLHRGMKPSVLADLRPWRDQFLVDNHRFSLLLILAPSFCGKTELATALFHNALVCDVGQLVDFFPDALRRFQRGKHDAIVLDDVRDLAFLVRQQHVFQSKYQKTTEFAQTPGGVCSYNKYLYRVPFIATANYSTINLHLLDTDDYLSRRQNCHVYKLTEPPFEGAAAAAESPPLELTATPAATPAEIMGSWSVAATACWLEKVELLGAAAAARDNGIAGADLLVAIEDTFVSDLRLTPFLAKKIIKARDAYLAQN